MLSILLVAAIIAVAWIVFWYIKCEVSNDAEGQTGLFSIRSPSIGGKGASKSQQEKNR